MPPIEACEIYQALGVNGLHFAWIEYKREQGFHMVRLSILLLGWFFGIKLFRFLTWPSRIKLCTLQQLVTKNFGDKLLHMALSCIFHVLCIQSNTFSYQGHCFYISFSRLGRSYLGVLDDAQSSPSLLDIPFSGIDNIVLSQSAFSSHKCLFRLWVVWHDIIRGSSFTSADYWESLFLWGGNVSLSSPINC